MAERLVEGESYGVYWFGRTRTKLIYGRKRKHKITDKSREEWVPIPVPGYAATGIPPEWVLAARKRLAGNVRWQPNTHPVVRLRGRIQCACGYSMTNLKNGPRRYYICSQHRKRGKCEHAKFHRLLETEERIEQFVLGLLENPEVLRERVEEQVREERARLLGAGKVYEGLRKELDNLQQERDGLISRAARIASITDEDLDRQLSALDVRRNVLEKELAGVRDGEERLREMESLVARVDEYLRDLPYLVGREETVREYETVPEPRTEENSLGVYRLTPENIRERTKVEVEELRERAQRERSARFRDLYEALDLRVVCHKDLSLEVTWGGAQCPEWLGRTLTKPSCGLPRARAPATPSTTTS